MELGNIFFGNSRGEYEFPDRDIVNNIHWQKLDTIVDTFERFENNVFIINPYYWGDCTCGVEDDKAVAEDEDRCKEHLPSCKSCQSNFIYKPTGFEIQWYKYPFRDSYMNQNITKEQVIDIFEKCVDSLDTQAVTN